MIIVIIINIYIYIYIYICIHTYKYLLTFQCLDMSTNRPGAPSCKAPACEAILGGHAEIPHRQKSY